MRFRLIFIIPLAVLLLIILALISLLLLYTGFLRPFDLDLVDTNHWTRDTTGIINGHGSFTLSGTSDHCWLLVHSFGATPDEMRELAERINQDRKDTVVAIRLLGHATLPGDLEQYTMFDWYAQIENEYRTLTSSCGQIHVVGSSIGGALALRLAEEHELTAVYAINPYLYQTPYYWYYLASPEWHMEQWQPLLHFIRRREVAKIADPQGLATHVAYYHLPVRPMVASRTFFETTRAQLNRITEPVIIFHSVKDPVSDYATAEAIYTNTKSEYKHLYTFDQSEHILLRDYDRQTVIDTIINNSVPSL